jgi:hypothetical protein
MPGGSTAARREIASDQQLDVAHNGYAGPLSRGFVPRRERQPADELIETEIAVHYRRVCRPSGGNVAALADERGHELVRLTARGHRQFAGPMPGTIVTEASKSQGGPPQSAIALPRPQLPPASGIA